MMAMSNMAADRDEDFNTRYGSYRGWQMAIEKVKPIPRTAARSSISPQMVRAAGLKTSEQVVDYFLARFLSVPIGRSGAPELIEFLDERARHHRHRAAPTATWKIRCAMLVHLIMSQPEYQLG